MTRRRAHDENGTARTAAQKRDGAARARSWRAEQKRTGRPLPRAVDAALVEAMAFEIAAAVGSGVNIEEVRFAPIRLAIIAQFCLERDGADPQLARKAVTRRMKRREEHTRPLYVPSLAPGDLDRMPSPKGDRDWSTPIDRIVDFLRAPSQA